MKYATVMLCTSTLILRDAQRSEVPHLRSWWGRDVVYFHVNV